jgi:transposase
MKAYSKALRRKIVDALGRGVTSDAQAARTFGVGISTPSSVTPPRPEERGEPLEPGKAPGKPPKMDERVGKPLEEDLQERPFVTPFGSAATTWKP